MDILIRMFKKGIISLGNPLVSSTIMPSSAQLHMDNIDSPLTPPIHNTSNTAFPFDSHDMKPEQMSNVQCLVMILDIMISQVGLCVGIVCYCNL